ncbi:MAG TPA: hypothetical protein PKY96_11305 [Flavobacteriales bacterium]|nr:hypothetical protein [Flavobacteriales bacterium]
MLSWLKSNDLLQRRPVTFILIALAFRAVYIVMAVGQLHPDKQPGWNYVESGDAALYLNPVDHLLEHGSYMDDYRMPGVGAPYFLFRQFLSPHQSRHAFVVLQWLLSGITAYLLGLLAWRMTHRHAIGLAVYAFYLLSAYSAWYDPVISSDSLSSSALILHAWLLHIAVEGRSRPLLMAAGFFLAWLIFLRPIALLLLLPSAYAAWRYWGGAGAWRMALLVMLPFLLLDSVWAARNWHVHRQFRPLTNQGYQPDYFMKEIRGHAMVFLQGYGGDYIWWNPHADVRWFGIWKGGGAIDDEGRRAKEPPSYAYVDGYDRDSLMWLADRTRLIASGALSSADSLMAVAEVNARFDRYAALYREKAPFQYHVMSRLRMFRNVMVQNGTESMILAPFASLPIGMKLFKLMQVAIFMLAYGLYWLAVPVLLWQWRKELTVLRIVIAAAALYLTLVFPLGLRMCEWRYLVLPFPFVLLLSTVFVMRLLPMLRRTTPAA